MHQKNLNQYFFLEPRKWEENAKHLIRDTLLFLCESYFSITLSFHHYKPNCDAYAKMKFTVSSKCFYYSTWDLNVAPISTSLDSIQYFEYTMNCSTVMTGETWLLRNAPCASSFCKWPPTSSYNTLMTIYRDTSVKYSVSTTSFLIGEKKKVVWTLD